MEHSKKLAMRFFSQLGFTVAEIPEGTGPRPPKRADLDVQDETSQYIIEVKEKLDTRSQIEESIVGEPGSEVTVTKEPFSPSSRLHDVLKDGAKQLKATPCRDDAFRLLWLVADSSNEMTARRALFTFYGVAVLHRRGLDPVNCVYFESCTAYRLRSVNGLVIVENNGMSLCLNEMSPRFEEFKQSQLVQKLYSVNAIYDPSEFGDNPGNYVLRSDVSRKNEQEVLDELERLTGIRHTRSDFNSYSYGLQRQ